MLCLRSKISIWYIFTERFLPLLCFTLTLVPTWWENVGLSCWISIDLLDSIWSSPVMAQWTNAFYIMHQCLKYVNYISQELLHLLHQVSVDEFANYSEFRKKCLLLLQQCASYHWVSTFCFMIWTFCSQYTTVVCTHNTHGEPVSGPLSSFNTHQMGFITGKRDAPSFIWRLDASLQSWSCVFPTTVMHSLSITSW